MAWVVARDSVGRFFTDHGGGLRFAPEARSRDEGLPMGFVPEVIDRYSPWKEHVLSHDRSLLIR
jgi:hypothetical protein